MFLLVPAHPGSPGQRAVKRLLLLLSIPDTRKAAQGCGVPSLSNQLVDQNPKPGFPLAGVTAIISFFQIAATAVWQQKGMQPTCINIFKDSLLVDHLQLQQKVSAAAESVTYFVMPTVLGTEMDTYGLN